MLIIIIQDANKSLRRDTAFCLIDDDSGVFPGKIGRFAQDGQFENRRE